MNPASVVLRWYRQTAGAARPHTEQPYTAEEVLQLLRPAHHFEASARADDAAQADRVETGAAPASDAAPRAVPVARAEAVRDTAALPSVWLGRLGKRQREELGELAERLPAIVFHHAIGGDPAELVRRFGGWGTWRYERALEIAGACIASHLNERRAPA